MPIYEVTSPDGRKFRVTAPDGATQEDALAYVQSGKVAESAPAPKPEQQMSAPGKILSGAMPMFGGYAGDLMMGLRQPLDAAAQLAARTTGLGVSDTESANQRAMDAYKQNFAPDTRTGADLVRGIGQALGMAPVTPALASGGVIKSAAQGAGLGGATGALTPVYGAGADADFWAQKRGQAETGAIGGGAFGGAGSVIGKAFAPKVNAQAQELLDSGVTPTPGQIAGGWFKRTEEKARSVPLLGDAITAGQQRAISEYNRSIYKKALEPLGPKIKALADDFPVGNEGIRKVGDTLSQAYESVLARSVPSKIDAPFKQAIDSLESMVPKALQADFRSIMDRELRAKVSQGQTFTPSVAKEIDSVLGQMAAGYRGSSTQSERVLGQALQQAQAEVRTLVQRYNPARAPELRAIDKGWASLVQIENAGSMLGAKEGVFTPAQFLNAVKKSDKSLRDRSFARGTAKNEQYAQAADAVLSQKYPDSGTAGRQILGALGLGGAGMVNPAIPIGAGVGALAYTPIGQRMTAAAMTKRPQGMRDVGELLKELSPYLGAPGAAGLLSF